MQPNKPQGKLSGCQVWCEVAQYSRVGGILRYSSGALVSAEFCYSFTPLLHTSQIFKIWEVRGLHLPFTLIFVMFFGSLFNTSNVMAQPKSIEKFKLSSSIFRRHPTSVARTDLSEHKFFSCHFSSSHPTFWGKHQSCPGLYPRDDSP